VALQRHAAIATLEPSLTPDRAGRKPAIFITNTMLNSNVKTYIPGGSGTGIDRPYTEYEAARDEQIAQLNILEDVVTELEKRLQPVLIPFGGDSDGGEAKGEASTAQLISGMRYHTSRIMVTNERVRDLLNRLCI